MSRLPCTTTGVAKCACRLQATTIRDGQWLFAATRRAVRGDGWSDNESSWCALYTTTKKGKNTNEAGIVLFLHHWVHNQHIKCGITLELEISWKT